MGDVSQHIEQHERTGPYAPAVLNPKPAEFQTIAASASKKILELGCGVNPRCSWALGPNELWVGCDPAIESDGNRVSVHMASSVDKGAQMVVFSRKAAEIPTFTPDFILAVAPNPRDVAEGSIIDYDLEKFLDPKKAQRFLIVLDNRTFEAAGYLGAAKRTIMKWVDEHGFKKMSSDSQTPRFKPNSADLGAFGNTKLFFYGAPGRVVSW